MSVSNSPSASIEEKFLIESLCSEFEQSWSPDSHATLIELKLKDCPEKLRSDLLLELIAIECERLVAAGKQPDKAEYAARFPHAGQVVGQAFDLWDSSHAIPLLSKMPDRIGEYRLVREIGRGGAGVVYEAVHDSLQRRVALKALIVHPLRFPKRKSRFTQEAQAAARLQHENIVTIYESGESQGILYYVMQLIEGRSLQQVVRDAKEQVEQSETNPISHKTAATIILQAANGLEFAHQNGVLHRDVKPSNLLSDSNDNVFVADFGLAKLVDTDSEFTATGDVVGSLRYLAPEAFEGIRDERADVFGLGLTLYELLTLQPANPASDRNKLMKQLTLGVTAFPPEFKSRIPRDLQTITLRALERDRADRYQSARELGDDLQRFLQAQPIRARRAGYVERTWKLAVRNPVSAVLAAIVALLVLTGLPMLAWHRAEAGAARALADLKKNEVTEAERMAELQASNAASIARSKQEAEYAFLIRDVESGLLLNRTNEARSRMARAAQDSKANGGVFLDEHGNDRRDWEWSYLSRQLDSSSLTFRASILRIDFLRVSPDDATLVTIGNLRRPSAKEAFPASAVRLWDLETGEHLHSLATDGAVAHCDFSPDGKWLATISIHNESELQLTGDVRIWDVKTGQLVHTIELDDEHALEFIEKNLGFRRGLLPKVLFDQSGEFLFCSPPVAAYRTDTWEKVWTHEGYMTCVTPDNKLLNYLAPTLQMLDPATGETLLESRFGEHLEHGFDFSQSGERFSTFSRGGREYSEWKVGGEKIERVRKSGELLRSDAILISPDGDGFIRCGQHGDIDEFRFDRGGQSIHARTFRGHQDNVRSAVFTGDGKRLVTADDAGWIRVWDFQETGKIHRFDAVYKGSPPVEAIGFDEDNGRICYANSRFRPLEKAGAGAFGWFALDGTGQDRRTIETTYFTHWPRTDFAFDPKGKFFAAAIREEVAPPTSQRVGYAAGKIGIWSTGTAEKLDTLDTDGRAIASICWSPDSDSIGIAANTLSDDQDPNSRLGIVPVTAEGKLELAALKWHMIDDDVQLTNITFRPQHSAVICATRTSIFSLNYETGETREIIDGFPSTRVHFAVSPDGNQLAVARHGEEIVRVYDLTDSPGETASLEIAAPRVVCSMCFSPNGRRLAMVGYDSIVYLCDAQSGHRLIALNGQQREHPTNIGFSPKVIFSRDGRFIGTNALYGRITVWEAEPVISR